MDAPLFRVWLPRVEVVQGASRHTDYRITQWRECEQLAPALVAEDSLQTEATISVRVIVRLQILFARGDSETLASYQFDVASRGIQPFGCNSEAHLLRTYRRRQESGAGHAATIQAVTDCVDVVINRCICAVSVRDQEQVVVTSVVVRL